MQSYREIVNPTPLHSSAVTNPKADNTKSLVSYHIHNRKSHLPNFNISFQQKMEETRDTIQVLLGQEESNYQCEDYFLPPSQRRQQEVSIIRSPLHLIAECANLVTDGPPVIPAAELWEGGSQKQEDNQISPTQVVRRSPSSASLHELFASSESSTRSSASELFVSHNNSCALSTEYSCLSIWRHQMFEWACILTSSFHMNHDVVAIAFDILDRYMATEVEASFSEEIPVTREDFQLFAMVSLYIAVKMTCSYQKLTVDGLIDMSRSCFTADDIVATENDILSTLNWHVNPPTTMTYCQLYKKLFPLSSIEVSSSDVDFDASCQCISDLAIADCWFVSKPKSSVALATVLLAARREGIPMKSTEQFMDNMEGLCTMSVKDFEAVFRRLESLC